MNHLNITKKKILFISVHPDDETLGCGGTILRHRALGDIIYWLNITDMTEGHPLGYPFEMKKIRNNEIAKVKELYGFAGIHNLQFPTQFLDDVKLQELIAKIDNVIKIVSPDIVYLPNRSDVHSDHRIAFNAIYACTKYFRNPNIKKMLMYETLSETEFSPALPENVFIPNTFIDITDYFEEKVKIMKVYKSEIMKSNAPRSINAIRALASLRGSRISVKYAEAFMLIFEVL